MGRSARIPPCRSELAETAHSSQSKLTALQDAVAADSAMAAAAAASGPATKLAETGATGLCSVSVSSTTLKDFNAGLAACEQMLPIVGEHCHPAPPWSWMRLSPDHRGA